MHTEPHGAEVRTGRISLGLGILAKAPFVAMPFAPFVVRPGAPSSVLSLLLAMPGAPNSFLFLVARALLLPFGLPSSFLKIAKTLSCLTLRGMPNE